MCLTQYNFVTVFATATLRIHHPCVRCMRVRYAVRCNYFRFTTILRARACTYACHARAVRNYVGSMYYVCVTNLLIYRQRHMHSRKVRRQGAVPHTHSATARLEGRHDSLVIYTARCDPQHIGYRDREYKPQASSDPRYPRCVSHS